MKTTMIARCVFAGAAIFAAAGLIGCGAEGQGGDESIGASQAALDVTALTIDPITPAAVNPRVNTALKYSASCVIRDPANSKDYLLVMGGVNDAGTPAATNGWYLLDPTGASGAAPSTQWLLSGTFTGARAFSQAIQVPGHTDKCLLVGGLAGTAVNSAAVTTTHTQSYTFTLTKPSGVLTMTVADAGDLVEPRGMFALQQCGTSKVAIFGGVASGGGKKSIEVWDGSTTWTRLGTTGGTDALLTNRRDLSVAVAEDGTTSPFVPTFTKFLVSGGNDPANGVSKQLDIVKFSSTACTAVAVTSKAGLVNLSLASVRQKPVSFSSAYTSGSPDTTEFIVAGGDDDSSTVYSSSEKVTVSWSATPTLTVAAGPALAGSTALTRPKLVAIRPPSLAAKFVLIGGGTNVAETTTSTKVQKFSSGAFVAASPLLSTARAGNVAEYLPSQDQNTHADQYLYTAGGETTGTAISSVEEIHFP